MIDEWKTLLSKCQLLTLNYQARNKIRSTALVCGHLTSANDSQLLVRKCSIG